MYLFNDVQCIWNFAGVDEHTHEVIPNWSATLSSLFCKSLLVLFKNAIPRHVSLLFTFNKILETGYQIYLLQFPRKTKNIEPKTAPPTELEPAIFSLGNSWSSTISFLLAVTGWKIY